MKDNEYEVTLSCNDFIVIVNAKNETEARRKAIEEYENSEDKPSAIISDVVKVED